MSEEQNISKLTPQATGQPPKRKRVPSQYAHQIADFKNNFSTMNKNNRNTKTSEPEEIYQAHTKNPSLTLRPCILPSGKKISVRIVVESQRNKKATKVDKKKNKLPNKNVSPPTKQKQEKDRAPTASFFDKFLSVVEELQKNEDPEEKEQYQASKENGIFIRRDQKIRRQKEQKWIKAVERSLSLGERLGQVTKSLIFLE